MDKILKGLLSLILLLVAAANIQAEQATAPHSSHSLVGVHGMALVKAGDRMIASHMPLHHSIHAHQVVFEVTVSSQQQQQLNALLSSQSLVSLMPETFDLRSLMAGKLTDFKATIYAGHFERGGELIARQVDFKVSKMLLVEPLKVAGNGEFYWIILGEKERLAVHQIGQKPSYDQLFYLSFSEIPPAQTALLKIGAIESPSAEQFAAKLKLNGLITATTLYLETRDFQ